MLPVEPASPKLLPLKLIPADAASSSETMTNLEQVRKFRLPKSAHSERTRNHIFSEDNGLDEETEAEDEESEKLKRPGTITILDSLNSTLESADEEIKNIMESSSINTTNKYHHIPEELMEEYGYLSSNHSDSDENEETTLTRKSKNLHAR